MKILAVVHGYLPALAAGSERMLQHMLAPLVAAGHDVELISLMDDEVLWDVEGVRCRGGFPNANEFSPDVIITHHDLGARFASYVACIHPNAVRVAVFHNERYFIESLINFRPHLSVFNTAWVRDAVHEKYPKYDRRTAEVVLHPPVEPNRHRVAETGDRVTLINLQENKGVTVFAALMARMPDVEFLGVEGTHGHQDYYAGNVEYLPTQQDMREVWSRTKILLVPSEYESYGMVAAEACVAGIPVIAHPTPGLVECLGDGGTFVDRSDVDAWEQAIVELLDGGAAYAAAAKTAVERGEQLVTQTETELKSWVAAVEGLVAT